MVDLACERPVPLFPMVAAKVGRECAHDLYPQEVREFLDSALREDTETGLFVRYVGHQECSVCATGGEVVEEKDPGKGW